MPRTTIDLDAGVLRELKRRRDVTGQSIGKLASELLARAMAAPKETRRSRSRVRWRSARMGARVDLEDKEAVRRALEDTDTSSR